jgi:hypothetical protein
MARPSVPGWWAYSPAASYTSQLNLTSGLLFSSYTYVFLVLQIFNRFSTAHILYVHSYIHTASSTLLKPNTEVVEKGTSEYFSFL